MTNQRIDEIRERAENGLEKYLTPGRTTLEAYTFYIHDSDKDTLWLLQEIARLQKQPADKDKEIGQLRKTNADMRDEFVDFVCSGVHNAAPYCANSNVKCTDKRGWCNPGCKECKGFLPLPKPPKKED